VTQDPTDDGSSAWAEAKAKEYWDSYSRQSRSSYGHKPTAQMNQITRNYYIDKAREHEELAKARKAEGK
jgi:hypothetical protein